MNYPAMKTYCRLLLCCGCFLGGQVLWGQVELRVQSTARPNGLDISSPVYQAGSDAQAADFQANFLPTAYSLSQMDWSSEAFASAIFSTGARAVDPANMSLVTDVDARVYIVNKQGESQDSLGFVNRSIPGARKDSSELLFPNTKLAEFRDINDGTTSNPGTREADKPVLPGDFAQTGLLSAGTQGNLDFFTIYNGGAQKRGSLAYSNPELNRGDQTAALVYAAPGSAFLLIGFDTNLSDGTMNFSDLVVAVDIGAANVSNMVAPEPSTYLILGSLCLIVVWMHRRRKLSA